MITPNVQRLGAVVAVRVNVAGPIYKSWIELLSISTYSVATIAPNRCWVQWRSWFVTSPNSYGVFKKRLYILDAAVNKHLKCTAVWSCYTHVRWKGIWNRKYRIDRHNIFIKSKRGIVFRHIICIQPIMSNPPVCEEIACRLFRVIWIVFNYLLVIS